MSEVALDLITIPVVSALRYTMSGRRLEAVELPEAPSQRKSGHIVLVEHLCTTALGHIVLVELYGALIVEHKRNHISILLMWIVQHF